MGEIFENLFENELIDGLKGFVRIRNQSSGFMEKKLNLKM